MTEVQKLNAFITSLNALATKEDVRATPVVLPRGTVLMVQCLNDKVILTVANGTGGAMPYKFPLGVSFKCVEKSRNNKKTWLRKKKEWAQKLRNLFGKI